MFMIGEIWHSVFNEVAGDDPQTRRAAALPYIFAVVAGGGYNATGHHKQIDVEGPLGP